MKWVLYHLFLSINKLLIGRHHFNIIFFLFFCQLLLLLSTHLLNSVQHFCKVIVRFWTATNKCFSILQSVIHSLLYSTHFWQFSKQQLLLVYCSLHLFMRDLSTSSLPFLSSSQSFLFLLLEIHSHRNPLTNSCRFDREDFGHSSLAIGLYTIILLGLFMVRQHFVNRKCMYRLHDAFLLRRFSCTSARYRHHLRQWMIYPCQKFINTFSTEIAMKSYRNQQTKYDKRATDEISREWDDKILFNRCLYHNFPLIGQKK